MKIRLFIFSSIFYMLIVGAFVFNLDLGSYNFKFLNYSIELPITLWFIVPVFIFFIFSLLHMSFYNFLKNLKFKNFIKDYDKFENFVNDLLLEKDENIKFKTIEFKKVSQLVKILKNKKKDKEFPKINETIQILNDIMKNGKYLNIKKLKLNEQNPIFLQNEKNQIKNDIDYAFNKIKNLNKIENDIEKFAFDVLIEKADYEKIKNIKIKKTKEEVLKLLKRFEKNDIKLTSSEFEVLLSLNKFEEKEYLNIAKNLNLKFNPDIMINIFKKIKNEKEEALRSYLYLLANFGMYDELIEEIKNNEKHKFDDFNIVLFLRNNNKKINLNNLIQ